MGSVEYERPDTALRYATGRALDDAVLARWGAAVAPLLPQSAPLRVLDLGAGTGIFTRAWPGWVDCRVVALEPARAMRDQLVAADLPPGIDVVAGRAHRVPLRDRSVDVAWLSAVIHHLDDLPRSVDELCRVLRGEGIVLIRGLFADLGHPAGIGHFPGAARAVGAFPSAAAIDRAFTERGFDLVTRAQVEDVGPMTAAQVVDRVRRLRQADTLLAQLTDHEIAAGLTTLERLGAGHRGEPTTLGLLAFRRRSP